jgi:two-component system, OmpR family, osmolarity sensor histidine kinase EnvZ
MSLIPKSLFGRNLLLLAGLIVVAQVAAALMFRYGLIEPRVARFAVLTAAQVRATQAALKAAAQAGQAERFVTALRDTNTVVILAQQAPPDVFAPRTYWPVRDFLAGVQEDLGAEFQLHWRAPPSPVLWVQIDLPQGRYWLGYKADRLVSDVSVGLLAIFLLVTVLALAGAALIQRRLNRPLAQLAHAATQIGRGDLTARLPVAGPSEIAQVAASFNQMSASLAQLENDRAIMLAGVSHDLRTPLAKMRLAIELLRGKPDAQLLDDMQRHIENIDAIIGQFLAYARIGNDETVQPVALAPLLHELALECAKSGAVFETHIGALPPLMLRPVAIRRALTNLLENAMRYGRAPFALHAEHSNGSVVVRVLDSGSGITPGSEEEIKKPFVRLNTARGDASSIGSGLGLAIADRVVRLHGGSLTLRNRVEGGFEAVVTLPVKN